MDMEWGCGLISMPIKGGVINGLIIFYQNFITQLKCTIHEIHNYVTGGVGMGSKIKNQKYFDSR